ncbi:SDR family NAD(P)-dependent oxidoreductase [Streptomyces sp. TP-A0356]|uniref:SDR family NAD(P)-dependent oxidoreductase n=1 Tax=Streptomyces sp. TP-A0356 TaxID=1359208 RepID=UPI0006E3990E|nr:SDR family oxidoreductase [Streptomyces sp. TP-A0356]
MRSVVVVLGASGGIGQAVTAGQAALGRHVIAVARGEKVLSLRTEHVTPVQADASKPEDLERIFSIAAETGAVDALVHTVFADSRVPLTKLDPAAMQEVFAAGATSALKAAQLLHEQETRPASCVLIGSIHAGFGEAGMAAYSTAKAALRGINRSLAVEWGREGIRTNLVEPGFVPVPRNERLATATVLDSLQRAYPSPRLCTPHDVAHLTSFLLSDQAEFINGATIPVDGGASAVLPETLLR